MGIKDSFSLNLVKHADLRMSNLEEGIYHSAESQAIAHLVRLSCLEIVSEVPAENVNKILHCDFYR